VTTAFVLTGGGSLGAVQVGMLAALAEHGIEPDLLVGTSAGALNAAHLAGPGTTADRIDALASLWGQVRRRDVFVAHPRRWVAATVGVAPSFFPAAPMQALVERNLGYQRLEQARLPVHVVAADLTTGMGVALSRGPAVAAVLASAAVPGLLPPVETDGRTLVDGGIGEFDPLSYADASGVDDVYLLPAGYPCAGSPPTTALGTTLTALSLLLHRQLSSQVRDYRGRAWLHVLPPLCPLSVSPADFTQARSLVRRSHRVTGEWLDRGRDLTVGARALALHRHHDDGAALPRPA
jgi:NTE family protein